MQIRLGLDRLRARNGFHEFEGLCLAFANARLGGHFVPATGPVSAGGDHGRDFTSYLRMVQDQEITFADEVVAICTTQADRVGDKIRSDLRNVTANRPVKAVFAFLTADMPIGQIERLKHEADTDYGIRLEIFDGNRLAHSMATADFAAAAYRWLRLDPRSLSAVVRATDEARQWAIETMPDSFRPDLHDYLEAVQEACSRHPWRFVDQAPDLRALYQPQSLAAPDGSPCSWQQAVERSQHMVISGPAGAGKSSLLQYVAAHPRRSVAEAAAAALAPCSRPRARSGRGQTPHPGPPRRRRTHAQRPAPPTTGDGLLRPRTADHAVAGPSRRSRRGTRPRPAGGGAAGGEARRPPSLHAVRHHQPTWRLGHRRRHLHPLHAAAMARGGPAKFRHTMARAPQPRLENRRAVGP